MSTFVLVHGAWAGAHGWHKVRPLLWAAGYPPFTPSLTGIGERSHLVSPQVTLSTHIQDVVNCVEYEDLRDIVLLGFSYGGAVVTGCVDVIGDRIAHLVYLDAIPPKDGQSVMGAKGRRFAQRIGEEWLTSGPSREYDDPAEADFATPRRVAQPVGTVLERVSVAKPLEEYPFTRTFIKAAKEPVDGPLGGIWKFADSIRDHPAWRYREVDSTHMVPNNRPDDLVKLLLEVVA